MRANQILILMILLDYSNTMTKQELANKVRQKYPGAYDSVDDEKLVGAWLKKYPVYQSQITETQPVATPTVVASEGAGVMNRNPLERAVEESAQARAKNIQEISDANRSGEQGFARSAFQVGGELVGGAIVDPVMNVLKAFLPKVSEGIGQVGKDIKTNLEEGKGPAGELVQWLSNNPKYQEFAMSDEAKPLERDIKAINEYLALLAPWKAKTALPGTIEGTLGKVEGGIDKIKGAGQAVIDTPSNIIDATKTKVMEVAEQKFAEPIPKPVENVLKETPTVKFNEYATAAQKATESYKNATPLEVAGIKAQKALDTIQRKLNTIGEQKRGVLNKSSVGNKPVGMIVVKFRQNLNNFLKGKTAVEGDTRLMKDISAEAKRLGDNPSASDVDKFIDFVQEKIYTSQRDLTVPVTDSTTAGIRKITGQLNDALKSQLPENYSALNQRYAEMVEVRNELNTKLGKDGERGGSLMKRVFSPSDARTKELFKQVKDLTGVDLVNEATLARYLMEVVGDARQASLLEQLSLPRLSDISKRGFTQWLVDNGFKKLLGSINSPEAKMNRARDLTQP